MIEKEFVKNITDSFLDKHKGLDDIDIRVGSATELFGEKGKALGNFQGAFFPKSRIVAINNENINSLEELDKTLRHELIGHAGINTFSPTDKAKLLTSIAESSDPGIQTQKNQLKSLYPDHSDNRLAEEVFATASETEYDLPVKFNDPIRADNLTIDNLKTISKYVSEGLKQGSLSQKTFPETDQAQFQKTGKKELYHEMVAKELIKQLEEGTAPWQKPWEESFNAIPHNAMTGNRYKGINALHLSIQGKSDPRWMTYKQAQSINAQVRKGEKGTQIEYYKFEEERIKKDENGKPVFDADGNKVKVKIKLDKPLVFRSSVFNAEQINGLPELKKEVSWEDQHRVEKILNNSGVPIYHDQPDSAYYLPSKDEIHLLKKEQFDNAGKYYATALHELGHATGHPSRLDRDLSGGFGSESYAKEELRAEISSLMAGTELGIGHDPQQHTAYVKSWIKILKDDPKEILNASKDAEKITKLVLSYENEQTKSKDSELNNSQTEQSQVQKIIPESIAEKFSKNFKNKQDQARFIEQVQKKLESQSQPVTVKVKVKEQPKQNPLDQEIER